MKLEQIHIPVLLKEALDLLNPKPGKLIFDGTLGGAGHTVEILKAIAPTGKLIAADQDSKAISTASRLFEGRQNVYIKKSNFSEIRNIIEELGIDHLDGILLDLGLSSEQIEKSGRGFSYIREEKLDMRFDEEGPLSAFEVLNDYSQSDLEKIFFTYGEEKHSRRIAREIVLSRKEKDISSTGQLIEIIKKSIPASERYKRKGDPSKRIFQALRIEVNKELESLEKAIDEGFLALGKHGRMVIISYHSLEDRIVKNKFLDLCGKCKCPPGLPVCICNPQKKVNILTKKAVKASEEEISRNKRASSARLRAIEKI